MHADKSQLRSDKLASASLVEHACQQLRIVNDNNFFLAQSSADCPDDFRFVVDGIAASGPLRAVQQFCKDCHLDYLLLTAVDMPKINAPQLMALMSYAQSVGSTSLVCENESSQMGFPVALHSSSFADLSVIEHASLFKALEEVGVGKVPHAVISTDRQLNINTPQQWLQYCEMSND
tara:strand:- start:984 stop:1514 length:531 start_codon:yes stop_codon:yes gene_type:complete